MNECPSSENWEGFLAAGEGSGDEAGLREHVRVCRRCQKTLDTLSDDAALRQWVPGVLRFADGPGDPPELSQVLSNLLSNSRSTHAELQGGKTLSFLEEPRRATDLGAMGPYLVEAELGRGGMGIVLRAFDPALERTVALKVLRPELGGDRASERFTQEVRAAARVRHDNVVSVYGVGRLPDGLPYCVMELLSGTTLAERIQERQRLEPREAAEIVAQAARGLAAAHAAGLVHRDVKSSNIMLDAASGRAKITDFGLACLDEQSGVLTQEGVLAGTPSYMSPEQVVGGAVIDARTDVYGLGMTLYEALTGVLPFRGAPHMILQQVVQEEPRAPRELSDAIPKDLETICLKCLRKEASRRYASATDVADDVRRFLEGEPIAARPVSALERGLKWVRRRRALAALGACAVLATISLFMVGAIYNIRLRRANRQTQARSDQAERNFQQAFEAVNQLLSRVGRERLEDVPELEAVRREILTDAVSFLQRFLAQRDPNDQSVRRELGLAHQHLGSIQGLLGRADLAERELRLGIALQTRLANEPNARPGDRLDLAVSQRTLGAVLQAQSRNDEAATAFQAARAICESAPVATPEVRRELALDLHQLGALKSKTGEFGVAEKDLLHARAIRRELAKSQPVGRLDDLAQSEYQLGLLYTRAGRAAPARQAFLSAIAIWEPLARDRKGFRSYLSDLATCYTSLGELRRVGGSYGPEEEAYFVKAVAIREQLAHQFPLIPAYRLEWAGALHALGLHYQTNQRRTQAEQNYRASIDIKEALRRDHPDVPAYRAALASTYQNLGLLFEQAGDAEPAQSNYHAAIALLDNLVERHPDEPAFARSLASALSNLGNVLKGVGKPAEAIVVLDRSINVLNDVLRRNPADSDAKVKAFNAHGMRAQANSALGRHQASVDDWSHVVALAPPARRDFCRANALVAMAHAGLHANAAAEARELATRTDLSGNVLFNLACVHLLAVRFSAKDELLTPDQRREFVDRSTLDALALLKRAERAGLFDDEAGRAVLRTDPDLDPIRSRGEFQELLERRGKAAPSAPGSRL